MADRFPLILNTSANQIQEIASGDTLDLSGTNVKGVGIITATNISGNIIAGAGTSNIVSGIITAVAADIDDFVDVGSNIQLGNAGVITATTFKGDGDFVELDVDGHTNLDNVSIAGVTTTTEHIHIDADNKKLQIGDGQDLQLWHNGTDSFVKHTPASGGLYMGGKIVSLNNQAASRYGVAYFENSGDARLYWTGTNYGIRLKTTQVGIDIPLDLDVDGHTNLDNVSIAGLSTHSEGIFIPDSKELKIGQTAATPDLKIYSDGSNGYIREQGPGSLYLQGINLVLENTSGSNYFAGVSGAEAIIYYNGNPKLTTTNTGINITGSVVSDGLVVDGNSDLNGDLDVDGHTNLDNVNVVGVVTVTGAVNASHSTFGNLNTTGITIENTNATINFTDTNNNPDYRVAADGGTFDVVQWNTGGSDINVVKVNTDGHIDIGTNVDFAAGIDVTGNATVSGNLSVGGVLTYEDVTNVDSVGIVTARQGIEIKNDTYKLRTGAELEMQVFHDGTNSVIKDTRDSGKVRIQADNFDIIDKDASTTVFSAAPGGISSPKIHTFSAGATVSGGTLYVGSTTYGSSLGQLRIINDASSTPASLSLFGYGNTNTGTVFAKIDFASQENGTNGQVTAGIEAQAVGTAERGADLVFKTRPDTSSSSAQSRFRIRSTGMVGVGVDDPAVAGSYHGMEIGGSNNSGLRLSVTSNGGWAFTDYEINGTQTYIVGCKGGSDSLSPASSWRICSGASFDANQLFVVNANGSVLPGSDNTQDFGSSSFRWANIFTGDLNLSNEGTVNDVDGTWGNFQIQEGENDLFLINKRNGKKYKFNLTEV